MFAPGFSSGRLPMPIRLFMAIGVSLAICPLVYAEVADGAAKIARAAWPSLILTEYGAGAVIGLIARIFILGLQFAGTAVSSFFGLSGIPGMPIEENESGSPLASLASVAAITVIMIGGLHGELLRALVESYAIIGLSPGASYSNSLQPLLQVLSMTTRLALRMAAPFLAYGVIVNLSIGIANRFAAQISVYHATSAAVMLGGFLMMLLVWPDWLHLFIDAYRSWLLMGGL